MDLLKVKLETLSLVPDAWEPILYSDAQHLVEDKLASGCVFDLMVATLGANVSKKHEPLGLRVTEAAYALGWIKHREEIHNLLHPGLFTFEVLTDQNGRRVGSSIVCELYTVCRECPHPKQELEAWGVCLIKVLQNMKGQQIQPKATNREGVAL